jgi:hypothetical protein
MRDHHDGETASDCRAERFLFVSSGFAQLPGRGSHRARCSPRPVPDPLATPIRYQIPDYGIEDLAITAAATLERDPDDELDHTIDDNERGLKDTVRVNPNEIAEIAVRFTIYRGRYMYHCHILNHEDRDMMRPFVTMPAELMPFMA